jgi:hypothetical protein
VALMECVILYRTTEGEIGIVRDANEMEIAIFPNFDAAIAHWEQTALRIPYQIVELDEL